MPTRFSVDSPVELAPLPFTAKPVIGPEAVVVPVEPDVVDMVKSVTMHVLSWESS